MLYKKNVCLYIYTLTKGEALRNHEKRKRSKGKDLISTDFLVFTSRQL